MCAYTYIYVYLHNTNNVSNCIGAHVYVHVHVHIHTHIEVYQYVYVYMHNTNNVSNWLIVAMTVSIEDTTSPKPTKSRNLISSVSCGTNSNWDFDSIWICTKEFKFIDLVNFGGVAFSVESVKPNIYAQHYQWIQQINRCYPQHSR